MQRRERATLKQAQEKRQETETQIRQTRFNKGLRGVLDFVTGKRRKIKAQNQQELEAAQNRDQNEKDALIFTHLEQRRELQRRMNRLKNYEQKSKKRIERDMNQYREISYGKREVFEQIKSNDTIKRSPSRSR